MFYGHIAKKHPTMQITPELSLIFQDEIIIVISKMKQKKMQLLPTYLLVVTTTVKHDKY